MRYTTRVDERYLELRDATWRPPLDPGAISGLVIDDHNDRPLIVTGISMGPVEIEVQARPGPPEPAADSSPWEEIVEFSIQAGEAPVLVVGGQDAASASARINPAGPGWYRVRVHAAGRGNAPDLVVTDPMERYLVQSWPQGYADPKPIALTRTSRAAAGAAAARQALEMLEVDLAPEIANDPERAARANARLRKARETLQRLSERN
ncbi:hypothetical protein [Promicromonospora sp. NPDC023805]|uniref:hypothetical protein n=1 Tax=Promicromonospora sp. NPDC023805 TaxID=3154696 RepID=UPI003400139E